MSLSVYDIVNAENCTIFSFKLVRHLLCILHLQILWDWCCLSSNCCFSFYCL